MNRNQKVTDKEFEKILYKLFKLGDVLNDVTMDIIRLKKKLDKRLE